MTTNVKELNNNMGSSLDKLTSVSQSTQESLPRIIKYYEEEGCSEHEVNGEQFSLRNDHDVSASDDDISPTASLLRLQNLAKPQPNPKQGPAVVPVIHP